jgi:hypothetical protein
MNPVNNQINNDRDDKVSDAYRAYSDEATPEHLDRAVLREAAAVSSKGFWHRFYTWRRPLAFAATLVLGVTLVYDMQIAIRESETPFSVESGLLDSYDSHPEQDASMQFAPGEQQVDSDVSRDSPRNNATPSPNSPPARKLSAPKAAAADAVMQEAARLDNRRQRAEELKEERLDAAAGLVAPRAAMPAASALASPTAEAADACGSDQYDSADTWWRCIEQLRAAGEHTRADEEWLRLQQQFPDFRTAPAPD